jgi:hypothetical protein
VRELIVALVGAVILIALGLAAVNTTENHSNSWDDPFSASSNGSAAASTVALHTVD